MLPAVPSWGAATSDPAADIEAQYETVIQTLKKPPISGVLVTEVGADSGAAAAGMRGGDIITEYYGTKVTTLQGLREQIAEAVARRLDGTATGENVLVRVRRGPDEPLLRVPREPLDIRAVEVVVNVPGPRNPPPNLRGTLNLDWRQVAAALKQEGDDGAAFRTFERTDPEGPGKADEDWMGWQICRVVPGDGELTGKVEWHRIATITGDEKPGETPRTEQTTVRFHLTLGDYKNTPAFVLDDVAATYPADVGSTIDAIGKRLGDKIQATIAISGGGVGGNANAPHENAAPLNAIPQPALPWVAAALPHEKDAALGVCLLSMRDLQARPGYVLVARGLAPMPPDPAEVAATAPAAQSASAPLVAEKAAGAWRVDLVHLGVIVESYWFSDQRQLVCMEAEGVHSIVSRRVAGEKEASLPMERKAATRPAAAGGALLP